MATFNIQKDSIKVIGGEKTSMTVTFKASGGRSVTCYHEVEGTDPVQIEKNLQSAANEFEERSVEATILPVLETNKDISVPVE